MNHQVGLEGGEPCLEVGGVQVQFRRFQLGAGGCQQLALQRLCRRAASTGDDQRDAGGACQAGGDALTEVAVTTENQNALAAHACSRNSARLRR